MPLSPRLIGAPGVGKTQLAIAGGKGTRQAAVHLPVHGRHAAGGFVDHAGPEPGRQDRLPRLAVGDRDGAGRRLRAWTKATA